jgi:hypothetical protein
MIGIGLILSVLGGRESLVGTTHGHSLNTLTYFAIFHGPLCFEVAEEWCDFGWAATIETGWRERIHHDVMQRNHCTPSLLASEVDRDNNFVGEVVRQALCDLVDPIPAKPPADPDSAVGCGGSR